MKKRRICAMIFFILCAGALNAGNKFALPDAGATKSPKSEDVFGVSESLDVDFSEDTVHSPEGVNLNYEQMKIKAFTVRRAADQKTVYAEGDFIAEIDPGIVKIKIEAEGGEISVSGDEGVFDRAFGYLDVSKITLAEPPNTRIYFGGDRIIYKNGVVTLEKGRITTDSAVVATSDIREGGYHFLSDRIVVEVDKQVTLRNSDFFIGKKDYFPFRFPWFRQNIRAGSEVPLFPTWTSDDYYGWQLSWGVLYGKKDSRYRGGFAPKFADKMGFLIGRWENWFTTKRFGTTKVNLDDYLVYSKATEGMRAGNPMEYEQKRKRYRWNVSHEYNDRYGRFSFNSWYGTRSMIPKLDELINTYESRNWFDNPADAIPTARPAFDGNIGFYSLDADLHGMGPREDISFKGILKLTDDKRSYSLMVYDIIDEINYGSVTDNDLYSHFSLIKDNDDYRIGGYYQYLYDMDPGSTASDDKSRAENFGFEAFDKKRRVGFSYDEKNGDKFRPLQNFERDPNLDSLVTVSSLLGTRFRYSYNPTTVREYVRYDSKDLRISLGEYQLPRDYTLKLGADMREYRRILDRGTDALRTGLIANNPRDMEYNRFETLLEQNFREVSAWADISTEDHRIRVTAGRTEEEFLSREGLYDGSSRKYVNKSDFYEILAEKEEISLGKFGEAAISADLRYDVYKEGHNPWTDTPTTGEDASLRGIIKANHSLTLMDNTNDPGRSVDFSLTNKILLTGTRYAYDEGSLKTGPAARDSGRKATAKEIRLYGKENAIEVTDSLNLELGNTETRYTVDYKKAWDAGMPGLVKNEILGHRLDFLLDNETKASAWYKKNRYYTDERLDDKNFNNLGYENIGVTVNYGRHSLNYTRDTIRSAVEHMKNADDSREKVVLDSYGWRYRFKNDDTLALRYGVGSDIRDNLSTGMREIDADNRTYLVQYVDTGDIEHRYTASYSTYRHKEDAGKKLVLGRQRYNARNINVLYLAYEYRDNRLFNEDLENYGKKEYNKEGESLTPEELDRVREILRNRQNTRNIHSFNIDRIRDELFSTGNFRRNFRVWIRGEINEARYRRTGDYLRSLQEINGGLVYSRNRIGVGWSMTINNGWSGTDWVKLDKEHKISLHAKIGKPSRGWEIKTYGHIYETRSQVLNKHRKKGALEGLGVEIGKEFGYYQWSVAYETGYNSAAKDYEWKVALQFKLLTFPGNPILGIGADKGAKGKVSPKATLFDGIKPEHVLDD
ncbi:MAG: hypothetical protein LBQ97_01030 [Fusobacteriaceae bacterium]|jgi:hypothetical protein|nr:hypothetical protein [Fusobacteriaceae bacterium]